MNVAAPVLEDAASSSSGAGPLHPISKQLHEKRTTGERLADAIAHHIGSWRFLIIQTVLVLIWIALNIVAVTSRWDAYPFVLLNLLFSVQAAYTGPVLLLSQNRSAQRDRTMADLDFVNNEKGEQLVEALLSEVLRNSRATLAIATHLGIELEALDEHAAALEEKIDAVEEDLAEVEDVLSETQAEHLADDKVAAGHA
jgi:uncharacterized membrane protein